MELDLNRFYNINRRVLMWLAFFAVMFVLRDFFAVIFLTFIFSYVMGKIAGFVKRNSRLPYWAAVVVPYVIVLSLLGLLITHAVPNLTEQGTEFARKAPGQLRTLAEEIEKAAAHYGFSSHLAKYVHDPSDSSEPVTASQPTEVDTEALVSKIQVTIISFIPGAEPGSGAERIPELLKGFITAIVEGVSHFLLAVLLSFLIVLDFDRVKKDLQLWATSPVGRFFAEAAASVINFSKVVGSAFQCQLAIAALNAVITCIGLMLLKIQPLLLLTTIVFLCGLIPVLGVFISSVPIVLIAFNSSGIVWALLAVAMITLVHMLEAYVFNPRIYGAWFHLNPVIVLIILLIAHKLAGVWGMLLGIPITHYFLNVAQVPAVKHRPRRRRDQDETPPATGAEPSVDS